jgi:transposase
MEACYTSNFWGRLFQHNGLEVDLIPPHQVKPFVIGNKNDHNDAIAIAEASRRPRATFVAVKTLEQQDIQSLERIRDRLVKTRTALANQTRGLLAEYGISIKKSLKELRTGIPLALEDANNSLTVASREFIHNLFQELKEIDQRINDNEKISAQLLVNNDDYKRLQTIPGIGPIISRSFICGINNARQFKNGREMAAWIGLTPKQHASGDKSRMTEISRRGNQALRKQLIHGARAVVRWCEGKNDSLSLWLQKLLKTKHKNRVVVALANKLARVAWAILAKGENYKLNA